jgi:hypothetical protein
MVFNATFNNISVLSWRSVLLVDLFAIMKLDAEGFMYSWEGRDRMVFGFTITYGTNAYRY